MMINKLESSNIFNDLSIVDNYIQSNCNDLKVIQSFKRIEEQFNTTTNEYNSPFDMSEVKHIVYDSDVMPESRGELEEFLCDCIITVLGSSDTDRMSNGYIADTLFHILDIIVVTNEQKEKLQEFLKEELI